MRRSGWRARIPTVRCTGPGLRAPQNQRMLRRPIAARSTSHAGKAASAEARSDDARLLDLVVRVREAYTQRRGRRFLLLQPAIRGGSGWEGTDVFAILVETISFGGVVLRGQQ